MEGKNKFLKEGCFKIFQKSLFSYTRINLPFNIYPPKNIIFTILIYLINCQKVHIPASPCPSLEGWGTPPATPPQGSAECCSTGNSPTGIRTKSKICQGLTA